MKRPRKFNVEISWLSGRRFYILESDIEDVQTRMSLLGLEKQVIDDVCDQLVQQRKDPALFPHVFLTLDDADNPISFVDWFANCRVRS